MALVILETGFDLGESLDSYQSGTCQAEENQLTRKHNVQTLETYIHLGCTAEGG